MYGVRVRLQWQSSIDFHFQCEMSIIARDTYSNIVFEFVCLQLTSFHYIKRISKLSFRFNRWHIYIWKSIYIEHTLVLGIIHIFQLSTEIDFSRIHTHFSRDFGFNRRKKIDLNRKKVISPEKLFKCQLWTIKMILRSMNPERIDWIQWKTFKSKWRAAKKIYLKW